LPRAYIVADLELSLEQVDHSLRILEQERYIEYDYEVEVVLDLGAFHCLPPRSEQQVRGAINKLSQVPETPLFRRLWELAGKRAPLFAVKMEEAWSGLLNPPSGDSTDTLSRHSQESSFRYRHLGDELEVHASDSESASDLEDSSKRAAPLVRVPGDWG
jgi:hypothetical protein